MMKAFYKSKKLLLIFTLLAIVKVEASELSDKGIKLFMQNKPQEAAPVLELASKEAGADNALFIYLGVSYQQLERWEDAINAFRKGLTQSEQKKYVYLFNIANSYFIQNKNSFALEYYNQSLLENASFAPAYLNRANTKMRLNDYTGAISDYTLYLNLDPSSSQATEIQRLIDLLSNKIVEEQKQKEELQAKKLAEEKLAEEQRILEEQQRQAMINAVAQSLMESAESMTNLSAGSGDVQGYDSELSLDD